ncbi:MAG: hypothetical protein ABUL60_11985, partial [Myxococcales bacterium]
SVDDGAHFTGVRWGRRTAAKHGDQRGNARRQWVHQGMMSTSLLDRVGILQAPSQFSTVSAALVAVRCWLDAAAAGGHKPAELCAVINVGDDETTALLATRAIVASSIPRLDKDQHDLASAILRQDPTEPFVLISSNDGPPNGDGFSNINAVLAVVAARAAAQ